ncbi:hypothetical protein BGZ46_009265 [Entomortierella lignicola]|nr:hypothetical protein BGZ46_009265 [Entomortierella lignicola]
MHFYIILIAFSLFVWVSAGVSDVEHKSKVVTNGADNANDATVSTTPEMGPAFLAIANGGTVPAGSISLAEEKADAALSCIEGCAGAVPCQNDCVAKTYNVNLGAPIPSFSASVSTPIRTTGTTSVVATATTTVHGASGATTHGLQILGAVIAICVAGSFVTL